LIRWPLKVRCAARGDVRVHACARDPAWWRFAHNPYGAASSANLYSLVACARVNGLEPYAYLLHLLEELPKANTAEALEAPLPWNVKPVTSGCSRWRTNFGHCFRVYESALPSALVPERDACGLRTQAFQAVSDPEGVPDHDSVIPPRIDQCGVAVATRVHIYAR
jgi:hypothetical protein